jgi:pimeloyl-ACP methyl ester carboxylesterase
MLPLASLLHEAGAAVLLYDTRGHGASGKDGPITIRKFAEDILAGIGYLGTRSDADPKRLGVLGRSIGGGGAILAASSEPRIRAVVSCSAFADPEELTRDYLNHMHFASRPLQWLVCRFIERWLGARMADMAPKNRIGRISAPLMLIHGDSDGFIAPSSLEVLCAEAPRGSTRRLSIPGRGHSDVMKDGTCLREIAEFFREHLALPPRPVARGAGEISATAMH